MPLCDAADSLDDAFAMELSPVAASSLPMALPTNPVKALQTHAAQKPPVALVDGDEFLLPLEKPKAKKPLLSLALD